MNSLVVRSIAIALALTSSTLIQAQSKPAPRTSKSPSTPRVSPTITTTVFISGKVVVDDGTPITEAVAIQPPAGGRSGPKPTPTLTATSVSNLAAERRAALE